jgi:N-acetylglucosamine-6-phosphate deacetylase
MQHRHASPLWAQLADDRLHASFIADLHHLPAHVLRAMVRAKGPGRSILTSDCVHLAGLEPGRYAFAGHTVDLLPGGRVQLADTELLAGSAARLIDGVFNAVAAGAMTERQAVSAASSTPAALFGLRAPAWKPRAGRRAHFYLVTPGEGTSPARIRAGYLAGERVA